MNISPIDPPLLELWGASNIAAYHNYCANILTEKTDGEIRNNAVKFLSTTAPALYDIGVSCSNPVLFGFDICFESICRNIWSVA